MLTRPQPLLKAWAVGLSSGESRWINIMECSQKGKIMYYKRPYVLEAAVQSDAFEAPSRETVPLNISNSDERGKIVRSRESPFDRCHWPTYEY